MALTGRFDFRKTLLGKVVLHVEEEVPAFWSRSGERPLKKRWRKASLMDLTTPELRMLMDMRFKPLTLVRSAPASNVVVLERHPDPDGALAAKAEHLGIVSSQTH